MDFITLLSYAAAFVFGAALFLLAGSYGLAGQKPASRLPLLLTAAAGGALAALCLWRFGWSVRCVLCAVLLALLAAVALKDAATLEIPDRLPIALAAVAVVSAFFTDTPDLLSRVIGVFCVSLPLLLLTLLVSDAFGGGDIKLAAACGLYLGWRGCLLAGFIAILLGGLWGAGLLLLKKKKAKEHFAFGPFLCIGVAACALFEPEIVKIFLNLFDFSRYM